MDDSRRTAIDQLRAYLERRQFSAHTIARDPLDLHLCCRAAAGPLAQVSCRAVDPCVAWQLQHGRSWATMNRRLNAVTHWLDFCLDQQRVGGHPVQPRHVVRRGRPLPKALSCAPVPRRLAPRAHPLERALVLGMLQCGLRVAEVAPLKLEPSDWEPQARHMVQGKGRTARRVDMSPDAVARVHQGLAQHPGERVPGDGFWHRKRHARPLAVQAIQTKMERYAKAAGITARGHRLRQTLASNLLEHGAEVVAIRDCRGQSPSSSSARDAKVASQKIKPASLQTMQRRLRQGPV
jgi:site-specific recombinase XerC